MKHNRNRLFSLCVLFFQWSSQGDSTLCLFVKLWVDMNVNKTKFERNSSLKQIENSFIAETIDCDLSFILRSAHYCGQKSTKS